MARDGRPGDAVAPVCAQVVELLTAYLEQALPDDVAAAVFRHLVGCEGCREYLAQLQLTVQALGAVELPQLPDDVCAELAAAFRREGMA